MTDELLPIPDEHGAFFEQRPEETIPQLLKRACVPISDAAVNMTEEEYNAYLRQEKGDVKWV
jgi:hypothetical protein